MDRSPHHALFKTFTRPHLCLTIAVPLILGFVFQWFFFEHRPGLNVPLAVDIGLIGFFVVFAKHLRTHAWFGWLALGSAFLLTLIYPLWDTTPVHAINALVIPFLLLTGIFLLSGWATRSWDDFGFLTQFFPRALVAFLESIPLPFASLRELLAEKSGKRNQALTGILIAIPILSTVVLLLASGDEVFSHLLSFITENLDDVTGRTVIFLLMSGFTATLAWMLLRSQSDSFEPAMELKKNASIFLSAPTLLAINAVYVVFLFIQFKYLLGGADLSFLNDLTFAEYARRGFGELLAVAGLNFLLVSSFTAATKLESTTESILFRSLSSLTVLATFLMLASSHLRLGFYTDAYGYTYTRFFVQCFLVCLGLFLIGLLAKVWYDKLPLKKSIIILVVILWTIISLSPIDSIILQKNETLYQKEERIDYKYLLHNLSDATLPDVIELMKSHGFQATNDRDGNTSLCQNDACFSVPEINKINSWQEWNWQTTKANSYRKEHHL